MNGSPEPRGLALAAVLALVQGAAVAAVPVDAARDLAQRSGLWVQLDVIGNQVRSGMATAMARSDSPVPEPQKTRLLDCALASYAPSDLRAVAGDALAGALQPGDVAPALAWYDGTLGRRIATIEETSSKETPDPDERLRRGAAALEAASEARKAALRDIVAQTRSVDLMADTLIEMALAVQQGKASLDPAAGAESLGQLRADLSSRRPQLVAHYTQISLPAYAFTYASLGDDDLQRYADYLGTTAAKDFTDGTTRGVARALSAGSVKLGRCLKDAAAS